MSVGLVALGLGLVALNRGVADRSRQFVWFGTSVFVSVALFGSVAAYLDNRKDPQVQAAAILHGPGDDGLTGLYVARNDQHIYLGRPGENAVYAFPARR